MTVEASSVVFLSLFRLVVLLQLLLLQLLLAFELLGAAISCWSGGSILTGQRGNIPVTSYIPRAIVLLDLVEDLSSELRLK